MVDYLQGRTTFVCRRRVFACEKVCNYVLGRMKTVTYYSLPPHVVNILYKIHLYWLSGSESHLLTDDFHMSGSSEFHEKLKISRFRNICRYDSNCTVCTRVDIYYDIYPSHYTNLTSPSLKLGPA
jgi:hypothetical protein